MYVTAVVADPFTADSGDSRVFLMEAYLYFASAIAMAFYCTFVYYRLRHLAFTCEKDVTTPADYAVMVTGFPEPVLEPVVEGFFTEHFPEIEIEAVVTIPSFFFKKKKHEQTFGNCVLILKTHQSQVQLLKHFKAHKGFLFQFCAKNPKYNDHPIWIYPSPDPQDLLIDNFGIPNGQRIMRICTFLLLTLISLAACIFLQLIFRYVSQQITTYFTILLGLVTVGMNRFILKICSYSVKITKPTTHTSYATRFAWVAGLSQFVKLTLTPYLVEDLMIQAQNPLPKNASLEFFKVYFEQLAINTILQIMIPLLLVLMNVSYILRSMERKEVEDEIKTEMFTLSSLRKVFLNPEFHIEEFYSVIISISLIIALAGAQIPILYPIGAVGMFWYYWLLKRHFIYYTLTPVRFSAMLGENVTVILYLVPIIMLIGFRVFSEILMETDINFVMDVTTANRNFILSLALVFALGYLFLLLMTKRDDDYKKPLRQLSYTVAREKFENNFKADYEVAINSLLDFRLEIMSFS